MESGKLRHPLIIQAATDVEGTMGNAGTQTWTTVQNVHGRVRPMSTKELSNAGGVNSSMSHQITIRYYAGLTTKHRILFGSRAFNILQVLNKDELNKEMNIIAGEDV